MLRISISEGTFPPSADLASNESLSKCFSTVLHVPRSSTVGDIKARLSQVYEAPVEELRIFFRGKHVSDGWHPATSPYWSDDERLVFTRDKKQDASSPPSSPRSASSASSALSGESASPPAAPGVRVSVVGLSAWSSMSLASKRVLHKLLADVREGFEHGQRPELAEEGSGGTYFLKNRSGRRIACFKPCDEEPSAGNNPRGGGSEGSKNCRQGVQAGEAMLREVAAFITDKRGFSGVPETIMVEIAHPDFYYKVSSFLSPKKGSLQRYVPAETASDYSPHLFSVDEVHKIGILDIRMLNTDRNDSNLLVLRTPKNTCGGSSSMDQLSSENSVPNRGKARSMSCSSATDFEYRLVPIDHGYCLPDCLQVTWCELCWLDWPQARQPFSSETLKWIRKYDVDHCVETLRQQLDVREPCLRLVRAAGMLLKMGAEAGLSLHDIGSIVARQELDLPSVLEKQIARSKELAKMMLRNARSVGDPVAEKPCSPLGSPDMRDSPWGSMHSSEKADHGTEEEICLRLPERMQRRVPESSSPKEEPSFSMLLRVNSESDIVSLSSSSGEDASLTQAAPRPEGTRFKFQRSQSMPSDNSLAGPDVDPAHQVEEDDPTSLLVRRHSSDLIASPKPSTGQDARNSKAGRFDSYMWKYLQRLLGDVVTCVINHRKQNSGLFRSSSSQHLTSPHREVCAFFPPVGDLPCVSSTRMGGESCFPHELVRTTEIHVPVTGKVRANSVHSADFVLNKYFPESVSSGSLSSGSASSVESGASDCPREISKACHTKENASQVENRTTPAQGHASSLSPVVTRKQQEQNVHAASPAVKWSSKYKQWQQAQAQAGHVSVAATHSASPNTKLYGASLPPKSQAPIRAGSSLLSNQKWKQPTALFPKVQHPG